VRAVTTRPSAENITPATIAIGSIQRAEGQDTVQPVNSTPVMMALAIEGLVVPEHLAMMRPDQERVARMASKVPLVVHRTNEEYVVSK